MISYDPLLQRRLRSTPPPRFCPRRHATLARHVEPHSGAINGSEGAVANPMAVVPAVELMATLAEAGVVEMASEFVEMEMAAITEAAQAVATWGCWR